MENIVEIFLYHFAGDDKYASRWVIVKTPAECLQKFLEKRKEKRSVEEFLKSYDGEEADSFCGYAEKSGKILSKEIFYGEEFLFRYEEFIKKTRLANPGIRDEMLATKENFYWTMYEPGKTILAHKKKARGLFV